MEVVARELLPELASVAPGLEFTAFLSREGYRAVASGGLRLPASFRVVELPVPARNRFAQVSGEQILLPLFAERGGVDLIHSLASTAPRICRIPQVVTVHDLIYARFPQAHRRVMAAGLAVLVPAAVRAAEVITVPSEATKQDVVAEFGIGEERIVVTPWGTRIGLRPGPDAVAEVRSRLRIPDQRVVLALSARRPHKNIEGLLEAIARIDARRRPTVLLPGYRTWRDSALERLAEELGIDDRVRFLPWLDDRELEALWCCADCFVHPAFYEGFGLPVLEAMARGVPVACSNIPSLLEIAGDAAILFNPRDIDEMSGRIEELVWNEQLQRDLRAKGLERAQSFSWQRAALLTVRAYALALGHPAPPESWLVGRPKLREGSVGARGSTV